MLEPLVNIDLSPEVNIMVKICHGEEERQELISVRQTVKQFKLYLQVLYLFIIKAPRCIVAAVSCAVTLSKILGLEIIFCLNFFFKFNHCFFYVR